MPNGRLRWCNHWVLYEEHHANGVSRSWQSPAVVRMGAKSRQEYATLRADQINQITGIEVRGASVPNVFLYSRIGKKASELPAIPPGSSGSVGRRFPSGPIPFSRRCAR
eukprot:scaffold2129_cov255-Pinguiococcus_pyrenoidosus.AAC.11